MPGFVVTTSIESAPMRDVRETSVEIGAVAGRPGDYLARFSDPATRGHLLGTLRRLGLRCPMARRHYDARRRFELTGQVTPIHSPALAVWELHATRGATDGATGGGHRASDVIPRGSRCQ